MRIIGIDPGSIKTGYGVVDSDGSKTSYVASGVIDTSHCTFFMDYDIIVCIINYQYTYTCIDYQFTYTLAFCRRCVLE